MAKAGDQFTVELGDTHVSWGTHRYTNSRDTVYGEVFIKIPKQYAIAYSLFNGNNKATGLGFNEFNCKTADGLFEWVVKTSGCSKAGDIYAKNLHGSGNLRALGEWLYVINAQVGDHVEVTFTSSTDVVLRHY